MTEREALYEVRRRWGKLASIFDRAERVPHRGNPTRTDKWVGCRAVMGYKGNHVYGNGETWEAAFEEAKDRQDAMIF